MRTTYSHLTPKQVRNSVHEETDCSHDPDPKRGAYCDLLEFQFSRLVRDIKDALALRNKIIKHHFHSHIHPPYSGHIANKVMNFILIFRLPSYCAYFSKPPYSKIKVKQQGIKNVK